MPLADAATGLSPWLAGSSCTSFGVKPAGVVKPDISVVPSPAGIMLVRLVSSSAPNAILRTQTLKAKSSSRLMALK